MIHFRCSSCTLLMSVHPAHAGRQGNCPQCGVPFTTPPRSTVDPHAPPPTPSYQAPPASSYPQTPAPAWNPPEPAQAWGKPTTEIAPPQPLMPPSTPPPSMNPAAGTRLEVVHGPPELLGSAFSLSTGRPTVIGRDEATEVHVNSDRVSRRHCQIIYRNGTFGVEDLGSSNGTLINQRRVVGFQPLAGGEYIQAGDCLFRYLAH
ncbi:MAG: FHA domain-containing protein [Planctomycetes bacterium]|nr:FHA domain-containing protein [Planctomycetota bacterium]